MSVILDLVTLCEKAINTAAKLKAMRLSEEEITLLSHARNPGQYQGQFHVIEVDQGAYPIVMAAHSSFADPQDAVASARYFDAFKKLCERNFVQYASGKMFTLTTAGFQKAAKLSSEQPAATVHDDCTKLAEENAALRQELEQARQQPKMDFDGKVWWQVGADGKREGPFCPRCYGKDRNPVMMMKEDDDHQCPVCKHWAQFRATASYGEAPEEPGGDWMNKVF